MFDPNDIQMLLTFLLIFIESHKGRGRKALTASTHNTVRKLNSNSFSKRSLKAIGGEFIVGDGAQGLLAYTIKTIFLAWLDPLHVETNLMVRSGYSVWHNFLPKLVV
jgi:hypothetical protein